MRMRLSALLLTLILAVTVASPTMAADPDASLASEPRAAAGSPADLAAAEPLYSPATARPGFYAAWDNADLDPTRYNLVGGHQTFGWSLIEPTEGNYQWHFVDGFIELMAAKGKAAGIGIVTYNGRWGEGSLVPNWVYSAGAGKVTCAGGWVIPRYWDPVYLQKYENFIRAFAQRYNNDSRVEFVQVGVGVYMETQPCDEVDDECVLDAMRADGKSEWDWPTMVNNIVDIYKRHLTNKRLLLLSEARYMGSDNLRRDFAMHAVQNGVGLQPAGIHADREWIDFRDRSGFVGAGKYDQMLDQAYETAGMTWNPVPMAHEMYDYMIDNPDIAGIQPDPVRFFWAMAAGLSRKIDYLTMRRDVLYEGEPGGPQTPIDTHIRLMGWAGRYMGRYVTDTRQGIPQTKTPSVWVVMRESAYKDSIFPQSGNYDFWLTQDNDVPGGRTKVVTYRREDELYDKGGSLGPEHVRPEIISLDDDPTLSALKSPDPSDPLEQGIYPSYKGWIARRTDQGTGQTRMYFKVDDRYAHGGPTEATIKVTYFDRGSDSWQLVCHNATGDPVTVQTINKGNTNRWKTVTIGVSNVWFSNMLTAGSDFYIDARGDGDEIIHMVDFTTGDSPSETHNINLTSSNGGWNFVSTRLIPTSTAIADVLSSIAGKYELVEAYKNGTWYSYRPGSGGSLSEIDEKMGFWIKVTQDCTLVVRGSMPASTTMSLSSTNGGWNLVGWPSDDTRDVASALRPIQAYADLVYGYDAQDAEDPWKVYSQAAPSYANDKTHFGPGQAVWVRVTNDCDWVISY